MMISEQHERQIIRQFSRGNYTRGDGIRNGKPYLSVRIEIPYHGEDLCELHQLPLDYFTNEGARRCELCISSVLYPDFNEFENDAA